ncbi:MAG TPA: DUF58 domain-containing protein [Gaiellaceae bacterium]|nr:DUF58 domain-containing protein [Gaiellaceae bacterium]
MTRSSSPKVHAYPGLAALGLIAALALGRPELAALAAPFAVLAAAALALAREPRLRVSLDADAERRVEGGEVELSLELRSEESVERLTALVSMPDGLEADENPVVTHLRGGDVFEHELRVRCARWGGYQLGEVIVRADDLLGFLSYEESFDRRRPLKVYPAAEPLASVLRPLETQVFTGNQVARVRAEGIEFADLRPYVAGDRVRKINWRVSARHGGALWVNQAHPERNSDVVLFLDTFVEARRGAVGTLDLAVRAAASLTAHYLREKDRVGLVSFGGVLNWLTVATGPVQVYRIVDSLLDSEIALSYVWKDIDVLPPRTLPPRALVIALSPLLDERATGALADLRARGFDLSVIEVSPLPFMDVGLEPLEQLAFRLFQLRRDALRSRYRSMGVPVVEWREGVPLRAAIEEVNAFRRHARVVRG